ncbi:MAG: phosphatase PAP2 family protein [Hydrogenothermaceae bacterium]
MSRDWETKIKWNVKLFYFINSRRSEFLDKFYKKFFYMGKSYSLPIYLAFFWIFGLPKQAYIHLIISLLLTGIMMPTIKYTFRHKRPSSLLENVNLLEPVSLKSFPSADSAYIFTIFSVSLFYPYPLLWFILLSLVIIIGYGRVYMGAHFPLDVIVGYIFGFICGVAGFYILQNLAL